MSYNKRYTLLIYWSCSSIVTKSLQFESRSVGYYRLKIIFFHRSCRKIFVWISYFGKKTSSKMRSLVKKIAAFLPLFLITISLQSYEIASEFVAESMVADMPESERVELWHKSKWSESGEFWPDTILTWCLIIQYAIFWSSSRNMRMRG